MDPAIAPREGSANLRGLLGALGTVFGGALLFDDDLVIRACNDEASTALGFESAEAMTGHGLGEVGRRAGISSLAHRIVDSGNLEEGFAIEQTGAEPRFLEVRIRRDVSPGLHWMAVRDATERRLRERNLATFRAVTEVLLECASVEEAIPKLLEALGANLGFRIAELFRWHPDDSALRWEGSWLAEDIAREAGDACLGCVFFSGEAAPGRVWATGEPVWIEDLARETDLACGEAMRGSGMKSALVFPVTVKSELVGVLVFFSDEPRVRDSQVLKLLTATDALIGQFLERMRLLKAERVQRQEGERVTERLKLLQGVTTALSSAITPDDVGKVVLRAGVTALRADSAVLFLVDASAEHLELRGSINYQLGLLPKYQRFPVEARGPIAEAVRTGAPVFVRTAEEFAERFPERAADLRQPRESWVALPLTAHGTIAGAMGLSFVDRHDFSKEERAFMKTLARQCALALDRARLFEAERIAKEQAESERSLFRAILMNAPIPVVVYEGPEHVVAMANAAWLEMLASFGEANPMGKPLRDTDPKLRATVEQIARELDRVYRTGEPRAFIEYPVSVPRPDGSTEVRYYAASAQPIRDERGSVQAIVQMAVDITEQVSARKRQEAARAEAEAETRAKDEFLAVLSHELRTPLQSMLGWTHLLLSRPFEPDLTRRGIETLERNTKQQAKLIEQLLDISRIIAGKVLLERHLLDLCTVVEAAVESLRAEATEKGVEIVSECATEIEVFADADRLRQVLMNLLGNAIKFTPQGGRISASLERDGSEARIAIADTGRGIPQALLPLIFDPFRQADTTSRRVHGGLGLGLAIVKHLVEQHGGSVDARSDGEGQGATFTVRLPVFARTGRAIADEPSFEAMSERTASLQNIRVLVVDDDPDASEVVAMALRQAGADVHAACSVQEAIELFWEARPHVLVSDIAMPDEDGYEMIRRVRAIDARVGTHTRAVALTAFASPADRAQALTAGYQAHLAKPVTPAKLVSTVAQILASRPDKG